MKTAVIFVFALAAFVNAQAAVIADRVGSLAAGTPTSRALLDVGILDDKINAQILGDKLIEANVGDLLNIKADDNLELSAAGGLINAQVGGDKLASANVGNLVSAGVGTDGSGVQLDALGGLLQVDVLGDKGLLGISVGNGNNNGGGLLGGLLG